MTAAKGNLFEAESILRLRGRAERAAAAGEGTFGIPEGASVAERMAELAPSGPLRAEASRWLP